jgi:hypothetical protein
VIAVAGRRPRVEGRAARASPPAEHGLRLREASFGRAGAIVNRFSDFRGQSGGISTGAVDVLNVCSARMKSLSPPIESVLELFKGPLRSVRFADIDADGLANLAAEVEAAASEVQRHEEALDQLRQGLAQRQEALLLLAQRALAYARVYAENDEPLLEALNGIALPRAAKARKPGAARATAARDVASQEPPVEAPPSAEGKAVESESLTPSPEPVEAVPQRPGRKARGSVSQRAATSG